MRLRRWLLLAALAAALPVLAGAQGVRVSDTTTPVDLDARAGVYRIPLVAAGEPLRSATVAELRRISPSPVTSAEVDGTTLRLVRADGRTTDVTLPSDEVGATTWTALTDTPATLGAAGQIVSTTGTALEFTARPIGLPTGGAAGQVLGRTASGYEWRAAASGGGSARLTAIAAVPAIAGYAAGDLVDVAGELYELVDDADESNVARGTAAAGAGSYTGVVSTGGAGDYGSWSDPAYRGAWEWAPSAEGVALQRALLPRGAVGASPPATLYARHVGGRGYIAADIELSRDAERDTSALWGYASAATGVRIETQAGVTFRVEIYTDAGLSAGQTIHSVDRWERWRGDDVGALTFAALADTPATLGVAGQIVSTTGTALEFIAAPIGLPLGGTAGQVLGRTAGGYAWRAASGGLDQAAVDARIAVAVPPARRVPAYAAGDAGETLQVASSGTALEFAPGPIGLPAGGSDGEVLTRTLTGYGWATASGITASGNTFPASPSTGDRFDLLTEQTASAPAALTPGAGRDSYGWYDGTPPTGQITPIPSGIDGVLWYENDSAVSATLRARVAVWRSAANGKTPQSLSIAGTSYPLSAAGGTFPHVWRTAEVQANPLPAGTERAAQVIYTDGTLEWPDEVFPPHEYAWDGIRWRKSSVLSAEDIRDELSTLTGAARLSAAHIRDLPAATHVELLQDAAATGLTITSTDTSVQAPYTLLASTLDLDDVAHGEIDVEATLHVVTRSSTTLGLGADALTSWRLTDIVFASALEAAPEYAVSAPAPGVEVGHGVDVYSGATELGSLHLWLGRNTAGQIGYALRYTGGGTAGANLAIGLHLAATWSPTDAPAAVETGWQATTAPAAEATGAAAYTWTLPAGTTIDDWSDVLVRWTTPGEGGLAGMSQDRDVNRARRLTTIFGVPALLGGTELVWSPTSGTGAAALAVGANPRQAADTTLLLRAADWQEYFGVDSPARRLAPPVRGVIDLVMVRR